MDRIRESRKSNGFPRHRHRNLEYEAVELREGSRKIGRNHDRELRKRRRHSHSHRDEGERSTEVSFGNEQNDHVREISRIRLSNTTSFGASDQNHRRSVTAAKPPPFKRTDEIIGVVVPRKARSGCYYSNAVFRIFYRFLFFPLYFTFFFVLSFIVIVVFLQLLLKGCVKNGSPAAARRSRFSGGGRILRQIRLLWMFLLS